MPDPKQPKTPAPRPKSAEGIQGEGDYAADRRYRERTDRFLESADVDDLAHKAAPKSPAEAEQMKEAEDEGRSHAHLPRRGRPGTEKSGGK